MSHSDKWLSDLSETDLLSMIPSHAVNYLDDIDKVAEVILEEYSKGLESRRLMRSEKGEGDKDMTFASQSWAALKKEFYSLLCTDDPEYAQLRSKLTTSGSSVTILTVAILAQALGDKLGLVCGPLLTLVATLVLAVLRMGKGAFCATFAALRE